MQKEPRILVAYTTNAGSTKEIAERIAANITSSEGVEVMPAGDVQRLEGYSGVVIGGPMILGWHRKARKFYRKHRDDLKDLPVHVFMTAMRVTDAGDNEEVTVDPKILVPPAEAGKLSFKEKLTTVHHYVAPLGGPGEKMRPDSIAIFGGKLDYTRLKLLQTLFVMLVIGEAPADKRNWDLIDTWAGGLGFVRTPPGSKQ